MGCKGLTLSFGDMSEADIPELTRVMTRAFDDHPEKHLELERGGPEGYDNGDFFRKWLFGYQETVGYKAVSAGRVIGAITVWTLEGGDNVPGTVSVDRDYQDRGVHTRMWQFVEATYPETKSWRLATPRWATKNHYFYEAKCGFKKVESEPTLPISEEELEYRKDML